MKKKMGLLGLLLLVVALILLNACATVGTTVRTGTGPLKTDAPLPAVTVIQPGPGIAPELASFSGAWFGRWDDQMDHLLVVEQIDPPNKITAVYSFGAGFGVGPGLLWTRGKFIPKRNELEFQLRPGTVATYRMRSDGTLMAIYQQDGTRSEAKMKRVDLKLISK